jgi:cytochrome c553
MPAHIVRLILLLASILVLAVIARGFMVDPTYYQFGNYRGNAVVEIAADEPKFRGSASCAECHAERHQEWSSASHRTVQCEVCHQPAQDHPEGASIEIPQDRVKLCSICHEQMPGRPGAQPQIVIAEHAMGDNGIEACTNCHNPHSPGFGATDASEPAEEQAGPAIDDALAALLGKCGRCHGDQGQGKGKFAALAGNDRQVLEQQLMDYRSGAIEHRMMNAATRSLSDAEITALAEYYATLPAASP